MYSEVFCKVYDAFGWNYYPEAFGQQLLQWLRENRIAPQAGLDLACGTGVLCRILHAHGLEMMGVDLSEGMIGIARAAGDGVQYHVADMITYRPQKQFDLVTCTGDALNHIAQLGDVEKIIQNVWDCLRPGGWFVFDLLNEREISTEEPFEMDFTDTVRVWFQMTQPARNRVRLTVRVFENGVLQLEEVIRETVHDPADVCQLLHGCGFTVARCADRLLDDGGHGTTWFVAAQKPEETI